MNKEQYRLLWNTLSDSKKLRGLPVGCQLVYTWLIPWADDDGRMRGDPVKIKANIVPHIDSIGIKELISFLTLLDERGLIRWYEQVGDRFIQILEWERHQKIRKDRYKSSTYPPPQPIDNQVVDTPRQIRNLSPSPSPSPTNTKKQDPADAAPVDNSKKPPPDTDEKLKIVSEAIYKAGLWDKVNSFVKQNKGKNKEAVLHTLERFFKENGNGHRIDNPWGYCLKILKVEEGNFNARDSTARHDAMKKQEKHDLKDKKIGDLCKGIP